MSHKGEGEIRYEEGMYKMATKATHLTGDLSSEKPDLCRVGSEDADNFYGAWVLGYGYFGVQFPKETTRDLTETEKKYWNGRQIQIGNQPPRKLNI